MPLVGSQMARPVVRRMDQLMIAAQHPQCLGLFHGQKAAADDNIAALLKLMEHCLDILRLVLAVSVHLHGAVVAVFRRKAQAGLECPRQPQIDRQVDQVAAGAADGCRLVAAAVIDDHIVVLGIIGRQFLNDLHDIGFLVMGGDHNE